MDGNRIEVCAQVENAVAGALSGCLNALLAVSGGLDSMTLLHAVSKLPSSRRSRIFVGTFDHGTGPAARKAAALVARESARLGFECAVGQATTSATREEEWRRARWDFLRDLAALRGASVVTAHTRDDQVETVFMRILREVCRPPLGLPAAAWMLEIGAFFLGTETELLLKSRRVVPGRLLASGFEFKYPDLKGALEQIVNG